MKVNDNIYPLTQQYGGLDLTNKLYPNNVLLLNRPIDESIIYSASTSQFASFRYITCAGKAQNQYNPTLIYNTDITPMQQIILFTVRNTHKTKNTVSNYNTRWAYDVERYSVNEASIGPTIRGFIYDNIVVSIRVTWINNAVNDTAEHVGFYNDFLTAYNNDNNILVTKVETFPIRVKGGGSSFNGIFYCPYAPFNNVTYRNSGGTITVEQSEKIILYNEIPMFMWGFGTLGFIVPDNTVTGGVFYGNLALGTQIAYFPPNESELIETWSLNYPDYTILQMVATLGLLFTDGIKTYCPIMEENGLYQGRYAEVGSDEYNELPQKDWIESQNPNAPYDGGYKGEDNTDTNNYVSSIDLNTPTLSTVNIFNRSFAINSQNLALLADFLWNADETIFNEIVEGLKLLGGNPIAGIINIRLYPFDIAQLLSETTSQTIVIGRTDTGVNGIKLLNDVNAIIDLGECTFFQHFKNFLDYEPYTVGQLYIPYIGVLPISTAEFMGHRVSVKMVVDFVTGACTAIVYKDDIPYIYKNGVLGIDIPVTGDNAVAYSSNILSSIISGIDQATQTVQTFQNAPAKDSQRSAVGAKTGAVTGIIDSGLDILNNLNTVSYQVAGSASPACSTWLPQKCYFIVSRPVQNAPTNYGHAVGYKCSVAKKLSDCAGFTVVSNPDIQISGTLDEQNELMSLLTGGVYL